MVRIPDMPMDGTNFSAFFGTANDLTGSSFGWFFLVALWVLVFLATKGTNSPAFSGAIASVLCLIVCSVFTLAGITGMFEFFTCLIATGVFGYAAYIERNAQ